MISWSVLSSRKCLTGNEWGQHTGFIQFISIAHNMGINLIKSYVSSNVLLMFKKVRKVKKVNIHTKDERE